MTDRSTGVESIHDDAGVYHSATTAIIDAVAAVSGDDPIELPALFDAVEPDALDALVRHDERTADSDLRLEFSYHGFRIVVESGPRVSVSPLHEGTEGDAPDRE